MWLSSGGVLRLTPHPLACEPSATVVCRPAPSECEDGLLTDLDPALRELAEAYGIAIEFWDWQGQHVEVPADTIIKVLAALDVDAVHAGGRRAGAGRSP